MSTEPGAAQYSESDDITRAMYFETRAFAGLSHERESTASVLSAIGRTDEHRRLDISFGADLEHFERAFHRLTILGVISDYTIAYAQKVARLTLSGASREEVIAAYVRYIRGYQVARANEEMRKATAIAAECPQHEDFVRELLGLYLVFVYDVIERSRRRALVEMLEAARAGVQSADAFRQRILKYLESTQFSARLDALVDDAAGGFGGIADAASEVLSPADAAELRGQVGRYLETYPDHPALLYLRGLTESLCHDCDDTVAQQNFTACLRSAESSYGVPKPDLIHAVSLAINKLAHTRPGMSCWLEAIALARWPGREDIRQLVGAAGLERLRLAPWQLLNWVVESLRVTG